MKPLSPLVFALLLAVAAHSQTGSVGIGTTTPNSSAALDVTSTNKAFLPPRMTWAQIQAIPNPTGGMMVYDQTAHGIRFYNGFSWVLMAPRQQSLADAPGTFTSIPVSGTASLYWYSFPSGRTKIAADGSLYFIAAVSSGTVNFGSTAISNASGYGVAIAKLDSMGTPLWMKFLAPASGSDITIHDLDLDAASNIYVCGSFGGTVDFNPGAGTNNLTSAGSLDGFLAKYDASGNYVWAQRYGGTSTDIIKSICTDGSVVYICGDYYSPSFTYGTGSASLIGTGQNIFLARAQASDGLPGASGWIRTAYCTGNNTATSMRVKLYSGSVLWGGNFNTTLSFTTGGYTKTSAGLQDCFFALYNSFGGTSASNIVAMGGTNSDYFYDLATSITGNIYVCGSFSGTINFGSCILSSAGSNNGFVVQYNSSLACQNTYRYGGSTGFDACYALAVDNAGNVYVGGISSSTDINILARNPGVGTSFSVAYIMKLNANLYPLWFQLADGGSGYYSDFTNGVAVSPDGKTIFSTVSAGQTDGIIGFDGQRSPSPNYFYISLYKE